MAKTLDSKGTMSLYEASPPAKPHQGSETQWMPIVLAYLSLTKPRVVGLVLFTATVAVVVAADGAPSAGTLGLVLLTGFLTSGGAAVLNHYMDRDIDHGMSRTSRRPLVTGQIGNPGLVALVAIAMMGTGLAVAALVNPMLALFLFAGAFTYVVVYTAWLKRRTPLNIVVGGFSGSFAVLGGWAAVDPGLGPMPVVLGLLVLLWTPAHFWSLAIARSADYDRTGVPMLPVVVGSKAAALWVMVHLLSTVGLSLALYPLGDLGLVYLSAALASGLVFFKMGMRLLIKPGPEAAWPLFKFSGMYLGILFLVLLADTVLA